MWRLPLALLLLELSQSIPLVSPTNKPGAKSALKVARVPKHGSSHTKRDISWITSQGETCTTTCQNEEKECDDSMNPWALENLPCSLEDPAFAGEYTVTSSGIDCSTAGRPGAECDLYFCPCYSLQAFGDPHLSNMNGDFFDITREGINNFLLLQPAEENGTKSEFRVDALIDHPGEGSRCSGFFIRRLTITSPLIGKDIEVSTHGTDLFDNKTLTVKVGKKEMLSGEEVVDFLHAEKPAYNLTFDDARPSMRLMHPKNRIKFATLTLNLNGAEFVIEWRTGLRKPNILEFRASNLGALGSKWSGLLAFDDHTFVSSYDQDCKKSSDYGQKAQLTEGTTNRDQAWRASASL